MKKTTKQICENVEKTVKEIGIRIYGDLRDSTPPLSFENYLIMKEVCEKNGSNLNHILKVVGHRDYDVNEKIEEYESRIRLY